eukprot:scaffold2674_cov333-Prasinococcus_capsulatus_cf.AAC.7
MVAASGRHRRSSASSAALATSEEQAVWDPTLATLYWRGGLGAQLVTYDPRHPSSAARRGAEQVALAALVSCGPWLRQTLAARGERARSI